jgi:2-hydroxychromene-2-carboxylate isomerase
MAEPIDFVFDVISPYAYIGWTQIHALAARHGRSVRPVPVLFAAFLQHGGTKGPAEIPLKRLYIGKDTLRTARVLGIPFAPPPAHPFNPLLALRVATVAPAADKRAVIDALFAATWGGGGGGVESKEAAQAALDRAGLSGAALVAAAGSDDAKSTLRAETERAIARGVFGVPTMIAEGEVFWGVDSFAHFERYLAGNDPLRPEDLSRWMGLKPSANRPLR